MGKRKGNGLSATFVRQCRTPGKYGDGQNGLMLVIKPSKRDPDTVTRQWVQRLTIRGKRGERGRRVDVGLGSAAAVKLSEARDQAFLNKRQAVKGVDPRETIDTVTPTFGELYLQAIELRRPSWQGTSSESDWLSNLRNYLGPIHDLRVDRVTSRHLMRIVQPVWTEKNESMVRMLKRISAVFRLAKAHGLRPDDPTETVLAALPKVKKTHTNGNGKSDDKRHKAADWREIKPMLKTLRDQRGDNDTALLALRFVILCGSRISEALGATWDEIDVDAKVWTVPKERMKNGKAHRIPLSNVAMEIVERCRQLHPDSLWIFINAQTKKPWSRQVLNALVRTVHDTATVHGFRSAFKSWSVETDADQIATEVALSHNFRGIEQHYVRSDLLERRRELMQQWADTIT